MLTSAIPLAQRAAEPLVAVTLAVPEPVPPLWSFPDLAFWWAPREGGEMAGLGVAAEVRARGADRFAELRRRAAELLARVSVVDPAEAPPWTPRLFGGLAFAAGAADAPPWSEFGDACFRLPRALLRREEGRTWLTVIGRAPAAGQVERALERLLASAREAAPARPPAIAAVHQLAPEVWRGQVEEVRAAIAAGDCEKIVVARRTEVELAAPLEAAALLGRLDGRHPDCFRFAVRHGGALFAGASPERLVALTGDRVETEAMAGSIAVPAGGFALPRDPGSPATTSPPATGGARALLDSRKDLGEHAVVTRAIARNLAPLCSSLELAPAPEVRALRHVMHLCTPVRARLERPRHLLEVAAALHPTPAVGGEPTGRALEWIAAREAPRGWYAGAVGWFDREGDGELAVALRSGLVAGERAYVWAGAGIVAESDPDAEYAETGDKQRAFLDSLGAHGVIRHDAVSGSGGDLSGRGEAP